MKKYVSIYLSISLIALSLFSLPAYASETVFLGDWGVGTAYPRDEHELISTASVIKTFPFTSSVGRVPYYFFQFDWKPNYTYKVICNFNFTGAVAYFRRNYDIFSSSGYSIRSSTSTYDAVTWNDVESLFYNGDSFNPFTITYFQPEGGSGNYNLRIEIVFDNDVVRLEALDYVIMRSIYEWSIAVEQLDWHFEVEAYEDPNNDVYQQLILDQLNNIQNRLDDIYLSGSDKLDSIPSNGGELSGAVSDLDQAEQSLYDRSDTLLSNVQPQLSGYISSASTSAADLLPVASFVTNIFTRTKDAIPPYVAILFTVIPLLLFVGWLIGRFK